MRVSKDPFSKAELEGMAAVLPSLVSQRRGCGGVRLEDRSRRSSSRRNLRPS